MLALNYPASSITFFAIIFEYVTFDVIPTDNLYKQLFGFSLDDPYSAQADNVGYPTRIFIGNLGSIPIFMLINLLSQIFFYLLSKIVKRGRCARLAQAKQDSFRWGGFNDFINEIFLTVSFAVSINFSKVDWSTTPMTISNIFAIIMALVIIVVPNFIAIALHLRWRLETKIGQAIVEHKEGGEGEIEEEVPSCE